MLEYGISLGEREFSLPNRFVSLYRELLFRNVTINTSLLQKPFKRKRFSRGKFYQGGERVRYTLEEKRKQYRIIYEILFKEPRVPKKDLREIFGRRTLKLYFSCALGKVIKKVVYMRYWR